MTQDMQIDQANPLEPRGILGSPSDVNDREKVVHPQSTVFKEDSAVTKAEKAERHGAHVDFRESAAKRVKLDPSTSREAGSNGISTSGRRKGVAPIKPESVLLRYW